MWKEECDRLRDENAKLRDEVAEQKALNRKKDEEIRKLVKRPDRKFVKNE